MFPLISRAADITLQGNFNADDSVQQFSVFLAAPAIVDIRSYGYASGTTSTGAVVPVGGFDTILTLFDATGAFLTDNEDGAGVSVDPATGLAADARITTTLTPGNYIVALTEFDNFSIGNLVDGFAETGNPHFTAEASFTTGGPCPGDLFRDISGTAGRCRTGNWAVDFLNVSNVTPVASAPEPAAVLLAGIGLAFVLVGRCGRRRKAALLAAGLAAALGGVTVHAQDAGPDYSQVSDFLNGQRTLLQITDLQVVSYTQNGAIVPNSINTKDSQGTLIPGSPLKLSSNDSLGLHLYSAHMMNQPQAVTITTVHNQSDPSKARFMLYFQNVLNVGSTPIFPFPSSPNYDPVVTTGAVADFTLDGYDDLALALDDGGLLIMTPSDVNIISKGFRQSSATLEKLKDIAVGDFNGDGRREIAGLTVLPTGGLKLAVYTVDPDSLSVAPASSLIVTADASANPPVTHASIARGRFSNAGHDQLAVAFATDSGPVYVQIIDFEANTLIPHIASPAPGTPSLPGVTISDGFIQVKTGQFALPGNPYDQIAYLSSSSTDVNGRFLEILTVDPDSFAIAGHNPVIYGGSCSFGMEVGNFDHRQPDPLNPGQTEYNPSAQIALSKGPCDSASTKGIYILSADPKTFDLTLTVNNITEFPGFPGEVARPPNLVFAASDLQGRSLTLGEPTKIVVHNSVQPSVVIGAPPMHVDFVSPNGMDAPTVFNVSAIPDTFQTTYEQEDKDNYKSTQKYATSWSFGAKEKFNYTYTIGDPDETGLKVKDVVTAAQKLKGSSGLTHEFYQNVNYNLEATSAFGDWLTYTNDTSYNIWVYPVIGQTVCPASNANCQPDEKVPLTVQFSAPNFNPQPTAVLDTNVSWYQPPWEPGNIFSYPANVDQLQTMYKNRDCDGSTATCLQQLALGVNFRTDASDVTQKTKWSAGNTDVPSISMNQNYSLENDLSVNFSAGIEGLGGAQFGGELDLSTSFGISTMCKNTTTLGESTGVQITKPGTFANPSNYQYSVAPYIMGTVQPGGVVDNQPLKGDVTTFGVLRAMFTADPLTSESGGWWKQAYNKAPDVALNHPSRWDIRPEPLTKDPPRNCLPTSTALNVNTMDCAYMNDREPDNPWLSSYHLMRGFLITSSLAQGQGSQLETAKAGDVLMLQARVYNYSLRPMTNETNVHVRFYFMPWNVTTDLPAGDSVLISEEKVGPIPPFDDRSSALNSVLVPTTFDTSKFDQTTNGNVNVVFWVLVWMEDHQGLLAEMPGHGLTQSVPGTLKSFEQAAALEDSFSNNLGLFKRVFYIASPSVVPGPLPGKGSVDIGKLDVSADRTGPGGHVVLSAMLSDNGAPSSGVNVHFYDGDPQGGGQLFDMERIPYVAAGQPHKVQAVFRARTCGVHQLFAAVNRGTPYEVERRAHPVRVVCNAK